MVRMRTLGLSLVAVIALATVCAFGVLDGRAQAGRRHARGEFDPKVAPLKPQDGVGDPAIGRMSIDKVFHGEIEAVSKGEMLAGMTEVKGSAGYVAMERVVGTVGGRKGTFLLLHRGIMTRGTPALSVTVVPDSGTGELVGLTGTMDIVIKDGAHSYDFAYELPEAK